VEGCGEEKVGIKGGELGERKDVEAGERKIGGCEEGYAVVTKRRWDDRG